MIHLFVYNYIQTNYFQISSIEAEVMLKATLN